MHQSINTRNKRVLLLKFCFIRQVITDYFSFIIAPESSGPGLPSTQQKISASVILFVLKFTFSVLVASLIGLFYEPENLTDQSLSNRFGPLVYLILGGMLLPCFEEVLFRLSLKFSPAYLSLTAFCTGYYASTKFLYNSRLTIWDETLYFRIGIGLFSAFIMIIILNNQYISRYLRKIWHERFTYIYYFSAIVFAWLHIFNFELNLTNIVLIPILTLPQLFSGLTMGYMRIKFGFQYPLLFHMTTNSILIGLDSILK